MTHLSGQIGTTGHSDGNVRPSVVVQVAHSGRIAQITVVFRCGCFRRRQNVQTRQHVLRDHLTCQTKKVPKISKRSRLNSFRPKLFRLPATSAERSKMGGIFFSNGNSHFLLKCNSTVRFSGQLTSRIQHIPQISPSGTFRALPVPGPWNARSRSSSSLPETHQILFTKTLKSFPVGKKAPRAQPQRPQWTPY